MRSKNYWVLKWGTSQRWGEGENVIHACKEAFGMIAPEIKFIYLGSAKRTALQIERQLTETDWEKASTIEESTIDLVERWNERRLKNEKGR